MAANGRRQAGHGARQHCVALRDTNGLLDTGFNGSGRRTVAIDLGGANRDVAKAIAVEAVGTFLFAPTHITLAGLALNTTSAGPGYDIALTRLSFTGGVDTTFGSNRRATFGPNLGNAMQVRGQRARVGGTLQRAAAGDYDLGVLRRLAGDTLFASRFERR